MQLFDCRSGQDTKARYHLAPRIVKARITHTAVGSTWGASVDRPHVWDGVVAKTRLYMRTNPLRSRVIQRNIPLEKPEAQAWMSDESEVWLADAPFL
jgi:hypothetical protein